MGINRAWVVMRTVSGGLFTTASFSRSRSKSDASRASAVGSGVGVGEGVAVGLGLGVGVGAGVAVGLGVGVGVAVAVGATVAAAVGVGGSVVGEGAAAFGWIKDDHLIGAGRDDQRFRRQADGSGPEDHDVVAGQPIAQTIEKSLIRDARRLDHSAHDQGFLFAIAFGDLVQLPAIPGPHGQILRHGAGNGEAQFFDIQAMVDEAAPTGEAFAAPLDLFYGDQIPDSQVLDLRADFDDAAREFMTDDIGRMHQARIDHVAVVAGFVHVHVGAADAHRRDSQHDLIGLQAGVGRVAQRDARSLPGHVGVARAAQLAFQFGQIIAGLGRPFSRQCKCFHQIDFSIVLSIKAYVPSAWKASHCALKSRSPSRT